MSNRNGSYRLAVLFAVSAACASFVGCQAETVTLSAVNHDEQADAAAPGQPATSTADVTEPGTVDTTPNDTTPGEDPFVPADHPGAQAGGDSFVAAAPVSAATRRQPTDGRPVEVTFEDLVIRMQPDVVFRPWMLKDKEAEKYDGKDIRIAGYIHPSVPKTKGLEEFVLLKNLECKFGPGGQADHLIRINLTDGVKTDFTNKVVYVEGKLTINPWQGPDGNTWSIYDLAGVSVSTRKRR